MKRAPYFVFHRAVHLIVFIMVLSGALGIGLSGHVQAADIPDHEQHVPEDDKDTDVVEELIALENSKRSYHEKRR